MKQKIYIAMALLAAAGLSSCQNDTAPAGVEANGQELTLSATVEEPVDATSKVVGNQFFQVGNKIDVTIQTNTSNTPLPFTYAYHEDGTFRGDPSPFRFLLDNTYITDLVAIWPTEAIRNEGIVKDQRELADYRKADWLTATATVQNVMPTDVPVPLNFVRENTLLEFQIVGQTGKNLDIQELIIELRDVDNTAEAYWAYCGNSSGNAELILEAGTELISSESYQIGRLTVEGNSNYTIIMPATNLELLAGYRYLVTLVPRGYDMYAFITIGEWVQDENGIAIPFQPPTPDIDSGNFLVQTPQQLIAMSYLIRHYIPDDFDWPSRTYVISDDLVMTPETAALYIPLTPGTDFSGTIQNESGTPIDSVPAAAGTVLDLYVNEDTGE